MLDNQGRNIRYLRLSVTDRCNFRCQYCMPAEGVCKREHSEMLSFEELTEIVRTAVSLGVSKVRLTGGEPLIRADFRYLLTELKKMGLMVSINSNASLIDDDWLDFFRHEPPFRFNITLYGGSEATYERLCGRPMFGRVTENIRALRQLGIGVKLNASMTPYNVADMEAIYGMARELEERGLYSFDQEESERIHRESMQREGGETALKTHTG